MSISKRALIWLSVLALSASVSACDRAPRITSPDGFITVSAVEPSVIAANTPTQIRITGTAFRTGATVVIGDKPATDVSVVDSSTIVATSPSLPEGTTYLLVTNPGGDRVYKGPFAVVGPCPSPRSSQRMSGRERLSISMARDSVLRQS